MSFRTARRTLDVNSGRKQSFRSDLSLNVYISYTSTPLKSATLVTMSVSEPTPLLKSSSLSTTGVQH